LVEVLRLSGGVGVTPTISEVRLASVHRLCSIAALLSLSLVLVHGSSFLL
ncbi:unnamed protein product, partial [Brassica rapa]